MKIPRKYFTPAPNVDAALFSIHDISRKNLTDISEERFFELVRLGFAHKRKKLASNIKGFFAEPISDIFERHNLDNNIRAEEVSLATWVRLAAEK
jgi:16S rRNA (adenine1518-N6/adenine1519-N6)-dimethyltransferase